MRTLLRLVPLVCAVLAFSCGAPAGSDGGVGGGAGGGGGTSGASLTWRALTGARRGPIVLTFDVTDALAPLDSFALSLDSPMRAATTTLVARQGDVVTVVWDSFADVSTDGTQALTLSGTGAGGAAAAAQVSLDVRDDPETARLVFTAHSLEALDGGGAGPNHDELSVFKWDGTTVSGTRRVTVGVGPTELSACPNGRAVVSLDDTGSTVTLVQAPLDADPAGVTATTPVTLPYGSPSALAWSPDGRFLYVLGFAGSNPMSEPGTLWRFTPPEDLSSLGDAPTPLTTFSKPAMQLAVIPTTGQLLLGLGSGSSGLPKLWVVNPDGTSGPALDYDFSVPNHLAVAPSGDLAVSTSDLFGDELFRYTISPAAVTWNETLTTIQIPYHVVFHPDAGAGTSLALVSELNKNRLTPVKWVNGVATVGTPIAPVSLAAEMDEIVRGSQTGVVFVSAVSHLTRVKLNADATGAVLGSTPDFGTGATSITGAVAVQR